MQTLFDYPSTAEESKARAIEWVWNAAPDDWKSLALDAVKELCRTHAEFTTDQLPDEIRNGVPEPRALGPLMLHAAVCGWCVKTDRVKASVHEKNHGRPKAVWRSMILENG
jgi:hypothetical protein